jgi:hypothetical protein
VSPDTVQVEVERVKRATDKALLVVVEGEEFWIPRSAIHDDSEVWDEGHDGTLVIPLWLAEAKGLA